MVQRGTKARNIRLDEELWRAAQEKANAEGRDASTVVRECLTKYVARPVPKYRQLKGQGGQEESA